MLFTAITQQEIGFFDTTLTGDVTSRLVADTTQLGDQVPCVCISRVVPIKNSFRDYRSRGFGW